MDLLKTVGLNFENTKSSIKKMEVTVKADGELYFHKKESSHVRHPKLAKDKPKRHR
jgi:hypothetical protein